MLSCLDDFGFGRIFMVDLLSDEPFDVLRACVGLKFVFLCMLVGIDLEYCFFSSSLVSLAFGIACLMP